MIVLGGCGASALEDLLQLGPNERRQGHVRKIQNRRHDGLVKIPGTKREMIKYRHRDRADHTTTENRTVYKHRESNHGHDRDREPDRAEVLHMQYRRENKETGRMVDLLLVALLRPLFLSQPFFFLPHGCPLLHLTKINTAQEEIQARRMVVGTQEKAVNMSVKM